MKTIQSFITRTMMSTRPMVSIVPLIAPRTFDVQSFLIVYPIQENQRYNAPSFRQTALKSFLFPKCAWNIILMATLILFLNSWCNENLLRNFLRNKWGIANAGKHKLGRSCNINRKYEALAHTTFLTLHMLSIISC